MIIFFKNDVLYAKKIQINIHSFDNVKTNHPLFFVVYVLLSSVEMRDRCSIATGPPSRKLGKLCHATPPLPPSALRLVVAAAAGFSFLRRRDVSYFKVHDFAHNFHTSYIISCIFIKPSISKEPQESFFT